MLLTPPLLAAGVFIYFHFTTPENVRPVETQQPVQSDQTTEKFTWPPGFVPDQPKAPTPPTPDSASELALLVGLYYGVPLGLGLWIFYRVVRFAVKG
jgi:hypothetical protein